MKICNNCECSEFQKPQDRTICIECGQQLVDKTVKTKDIIEPTEEIGLKKSVNIVMIALVLIIVMLSSIVGILLLKPKTSTVVKESTPVENEKILETPTEAPTKTEELVTPTPIKTPPIEVKPLNFEIVQVDSSNFPNIKFYINATDENNNVVKNLTQNQFSIEEVDISGKIMPANIIKMNQILESERVSLNLVLDKSGSMGDENKMSQSQYAAATFLTNVSASKNDLIQLTFFDDYVYIPEYFSNNYADLTEIVYNVEPYGQTALFDAIYSALLETNKQSGAKCVIIFTDGMENRSSYSYDDVVQFAKATAIPLYIIGIGNDCDVNVLKSLANMTNGKYYSAQTDNLGTALTQIYSNVYKSQREWYVFEYNSSSQENLYDFRKISLTANEDMGFSGGFNKEYVPIQNINSSFSDKYKNKDFILDFTSKKLATNDDFIGLSLAELRIARNEIFAKYGRQFKDPMLNKWFYSKPWYLSIMDKYSPADFDKLKTPLSKIELENINIIREYEKYIMNNERIFPHSSDFELTEYDVSLSKAILQKGLKEIYYYSNVEFGDNNSLSTIELKNVKLIENAMSQVEIQY